MKKLLALILLAAAPFSANAAAHTPAQHSQTVQTKAVWIDVRSKQEFEEGHLNNAVNIPLDQIAERIQTSVPDKSTPVNLYCRSGRRAEAALQLLKQAGYTNVRNHGGYQDLLKQGME